MNLTPPPLTNFRKYTGKFVFSPQYFVFGGGGGGGQDPSGSHHPYSSNGSSGSFAGAPCLQHSRCRHEADSARVHLLIYLQVMRANPADPPGGAPPADGAALRR